jgi:hypothetical protein
MSDTIQGVSWAIERKCPIRDGSDWQRPNVALHQTGGVRNLASARRDRRLDDWADEGVDPTADATGKSMTITADVTLNGKTFTSTLTKSYSGKAGKGGAFK